MNEHKQPVWTVAQKTTPGATPGKNKVVLKLMANGVCVHTLNGLHALTQIEAYAADLNARNVPAPPPGVKMRLDGWNQPKDLAKVPHVIPREVFNYQIP